jgi:predicted outer membrane protein
MKNKFLKAVVIGSSLTMGFAAFAHGDMGGTAGHEHAKMTLGVGDLQEADAHALMLLHHINHVEIKDGQLAKSTSQNDKVKDYGDMLAKDHQDLDTKVTDLASKHNVMFPAAMMHSGMGGAGEMGTMDEQKSDEMNRQDMQADQAAKDDLKASDQAAQEGTGGAGQTGMANTTDQQAPKDQTATAPMKETAPSATGTATTTGKTVTLSQKDMNLMKHSHEQAMRLEKLSGSNFDKAFVGDEVKDHQTALQELKGAQASLKNDDVKDLVKTAMDKMQNHLDEGKKLQASLRGAQARTPPAK